MAKWAKGEFDKLPARIQRILYEVRQGRTLCKSLRLKASGETEVTFYLEPGGKKVGESSARAAIATQFLLPGEDGLFDGTDQTWRAA